MTQGLSVGRLIRTQVNLAPLAAQRRGFGTLLIVGDTPAIPTGEAFRTYTTLESVLEDFSLSDPEYLGAQAYFSQVPKPLTLMIGRWVATAAAGYLACGELSEIDQEMAAWTGITTGSFAIAIDGAAAVDITGLDFSAETNLNGVASVITAALTGATCLWDGERFIFSSITTGSGSSIGYLTPALTGSPIASQLRGSVGLANPPVAGFAAETAAGSVVRLANASALWFGLAFCCTTMPDDADVVEISGYVEAAEIERVYGVTVGAAVLDPLNLNNIAVQLKDLKRRRTFTQYSENINAVCSFMGRAFSVNFSANRSTITLMYKQEPGVVAEYITETQAQLLKARRCNVFVNYVNDTAIIQYGVMAGDAYFDEIHGLSWFKDAIQNSEYNLLYQSKTKIPQTDAGQNQLIAAAAAVCNEAVNNGLVAPGQWNADGFGQLQRGDYLKSGYYIFSQPMALQDQSQREARIAPPIQIAIKLAGAIHELDIIVDVNR